MSLSRWIFIISNALIMLVLVLLHTLTDQVFTHTSPYPKHVHKTLFIDNHFNNKEKKEIIQAAAEWTKETHHLVTFEIQMLPSNKKIQPVTDIIVIPVTVNFPDIVLSDNYYKNHGTVGYFNNRSTINFIELVTERVLPENFKSTVLHELGHSLGLEHTDEIEGINTLMYPALEGGANHVTHKDIISFCVLYQCNPEKLEN